MEKSRRGGTCDDTESGAITIILILCSKCVYALRYLSTCESQSSHPIDLSAHA